MHKGKKALIAIAIVALALVLLVVLTPQETNGSPEPITRRIPLGEEIHSDHNGYQIYYYHGYHTYRIHIGHLAMSGTRAGMSNIEIYVEPGWNLTIGQKQYRVVAFDYQWIELEELG